jgi:hypothetical protein
MCCNVISSCGVGSACMGAMCLWSHNRTERVVWLSWRESLWLVVMCHGSGPRTNKWTGRLLTNVEQPTAQWVGYASQSTAVRFGKYSQWLLHRHPSVYEHPVYEDSVLRQAVIFTLWYVGPCHHGMARSQVADELPADMVGSCEYIE